MHSYTNIHKLYKHNNSILPSITLRWSGLLPGFAIIYARSISIINILSGFMIAALYYIRSCTDFCSHTHTDTIWINTNILWTHKSSRIEIHRVAIDAYHHHTRTARSPLRERGVNFYLFIICAVGRCCHLGFCCAHLEDRHLCSEPRECVYECMCVYACEGSICGRKGCCEFSPVWKACAR